MKVALFSALMILASAGAVRAQDEQNAAQPPTQPPAEAPPAPPAEPPAPPSVMQSPEANTPQPQGQQATGQGQWVFTSQYGWLWMPYGAQYTYEPPAVQGSYVYPYSYVYYPSYGWAWLYSPWVWGWGPSPFFGYYGPRHFVWYRGPGFYPRGWVARPYPGWGVYGHGFYRGGFGGYRTGFGGFHSGSSGFHGSSGVGGHRGGGRR